MAKVGSGRKKLAVAKRGGLAKPKLRVSKEAAAHCEKFLDKYLGQILIWREGPGDPRDLAARRAKLASEIGANLCRASGRTFVEQVYLSWLAARDLHRRVLEIRRHAEARKEEKEKINKSSQTVLMVL